MIDALFGSKTRVKLLHLFLNNPGQRYYVREITRKIDEQINSVRRELSNMLEVGIITCDSADNRLYYKVSQTYDYYAPLKAIFSDTKSTEESLPINSISNSGKDYNSIIQSISGLNIAIFAGSLVKGSKSSVDILFVGSVVPSKVKSIVVDIEKSEKHEINYSVVSYEEFYYRLSVRDKFITEILNSKHVVVFDKDNLLG